MKGMIALASIVSVGCVSTGTHRHHRTDPVEALLVVGAAALAMAVTAEPPPPPPPPRRVVGDPRIQPPDPTRPATFEGWVVADDGSGPVSFAVVDLVGQGVEVRVLTNADGHFRICRPLRAGGYRLVVIDEGWEGETEAGVEEGRVPAVVLRAHPAR
jgi:hypothetical protein